MKSQMEQMAELLRGIASVKETTNGIVNGKGKGDPLPMQEGGGVLGLVASTERSSNEEVRTQGRESHVVAMCTGLGSPVVSPAKELGQV